MQLSLISPEGFA